VISLALKFLLATVILIAVAWGAIFWLSDRLREEEVEEEAEWWPWVEDEPESRDE